jgi:hypothetical protein
VPVTFLAHQAPVLPIVRRWPRSVDGIALVVGTAAPDLAYVANGSRYAVWAHGWPGVVTFCVPVTVGVAWIIARVLAPVVPCHLPDLGTFHVRDYRGLAVHRFGLLRTPLCALAGALTHVALDSFTHEWGWLAQHVGWYRDPIVDTELLGRRWTPFRVAQYAGHVVLSAFTVWWLWRAGARRWLAARAASVPCRATRAGAALLAGWCGVGTAAASGWVLTDRAGSATDIVRVATGAFAGLTLGALVTRAVTGPATTAAALDARAVRRP